MKEYGKTIDREGLMTKIMNCYPTFNVIWGWTISTQVFKPSESFMNYTVVDWRGFHN